MANNNNIESLMNGLLNPGQAQKLASNKGGLNALLDSEDGKRVKSIVEKDADTLGAAVKNGDMETLQKAMKSILQSEEGARLAKQLGEMMK